MRLKCFESTDSNGIEQYLIPLEDGSFIAIPKERISCLMMEQGIDCENCPRRFTCHEQPIIEPKRGRWIRSSEIDIAWGSKTYTCSNCGRKQNDMTNFCCECGADMRESN